jgi:hypothetical protein
MLSNDRKPYFQIQVYAGRSEQLDEDACAGTASVVPKELGGASNPLSTDRDRLRCNTSGRLETENDAL